MFEHNEISRMPNSHEDWLIVYQTKIARTGKEKEDRLIELFREIKKMYGKKKARLAMLDEAPHILEDENPLGGSLGIRLNPKNALEWQAFYLPDGMRTVDELQKIVNAQKKPSPGDIRLANVLNSL